MFAGNGALGREILCKFAGMIDDCLGCEPQNWRSRGALSREGNVIQEKRSNSCRRKPGTRKQGSGPAFLFFEKAQEKMDRFHLPSAMPGSQLFGGFQRANRGRGEVMGYQSFSLQLRGTVDCILRYK